MDVIWTSKEETLTDWEVGEALLFFFGKFESFGKNVNGGSGLFKK